MCSSRARCCGASRAREAARYDRARPGAQARRAAPAGPRHGPVGAARRRATDAGTGAEGAAHGADRVPAPVGRCSRAGASPRTSWRRSPKSIRHRGVMQPLLVRRAPDGGDFYEIVAGERRWRAAQIAGVHELPVVVYELSDRDALEVALLENVQRQDLSPLEEAEGYRRLIDEFGHTQDELARALGKSRSHIANLLRLLGLPARGAGDARAAASCRPGTRGRCSARRDPLALAHAGGRPRPERAADRGAGARRDAQRAAARPAAAARTPNTLALEQDLAAPPRSAGLSDAQGQRRHAADRLRLARAARRADQAAELSRAPLQAARRTVCGETPASRRNGRRGVRRLR